MSLTVDLDSNPPIEERGIRDALAALLADPAFEATERNRKFLRFIVEETLAGRSDRLKSYTIAVDVFGRSADFDASADGIVRTEAVRLRTALSRYYAVKADIDVRIDLPKGRYVPRFENVAHKSFVSPRADVEEADETSEATVGMDDRGSRSGRSSRSAPRRQRFRKLPLYGATVALVAGMAIAGWWLMPDRPVAFTEPPLIVVDRIAALSEDSTTKVLARTLDQSLVTATEQFDGLSVTPLPNAAILDDFLSKKESEESRRSVYLLTASVRVDGDHVRLWWRLTNARTQEVLWSTAFDGSWPNGPDSTVEAAIAEKIATLIGDRAGLVKTTEARAWLGNPQPGYPCVLRATQYSLTMSPGTQRILRDCLEKTVATTPDYADAWAYLAQMYTEETRMGFNLRGEPADAMKRARHAADRALSLAPFSGLAHWAGMVAAFERGDLPAFEQEEKRALEISPDNPRLLVFVGNRLFYMGRWEEGLALVKRSVDSNPKPAPLDRGIFYLDFYRRGEYQKALEVFNSIPLPDQYFHLAMGAAICAKLGNANAARSYLQRVLELRPDYGAAMRQDFRHRQLPESFIDAVADGLRLAGLDVK